MDLYFESLPVITALRYGVDVRRYHLAYQLSAWCSPIERRVDVAAYKLVRLGSLRDPGDEGVRESTTTTVTFIRGGQPVSRNERALHRDIDLVVREARNELPRAACSRMHCCLRPTWFHDDCNNILGHSTSVNVFPWSTSAYCSKGEEKCSRTARGALSESSSHAR